MDKIKEIPFKRTILGGNFNLPPSTEVWFLFPEEKEELERQIANLYKPPEDLIKEIARKNLKKFLADLSDRNIYVCHKDMIEVYCERIAQQIANLDKPPEKTIVVGDAAIGRAVLLAACQENKPPEEVLLSDEEIAKLPFGNCTECDADETTNCRVCDGKVVAKAQALKAKLYYEGRK